MLFVGRNDGLGRCGGMEVSVWGPYPVCPELYDRVCARAAELDGGPLEYKALDHVPLYRNSLNCAHAVQSVFVDEYSMVGLFGFGEPITRETLDLYAPHILDWTPDLPVLGLMGVCVDGVNLRSPCDRPGRWHSFRSFLSPANESRTSGKDLTVSEDSRFTGGRHIRPHMSTDSRPRRLSA